jgi:hypothetical protein
MEPSPLQTQAGQGPGTQVAYDTQGHPDVVPAHPPGLIGRPVGHRVQRGTP